LSTHVEGGGTFVRTCAGKKARPEFAAFRGEFSHFRAGGQTFRAPLRASGGK
jgi:hypothetical protein